MATSYGYDNGGEQTSRTVGGVAYTLAYDYEGQLLSITHSTTTVSFTYDAEGRRMSRTSGGTTTSFYYDGGQVQLEAQGGTVTSVYSYGNSLTRKDGEFPLFDGHGSERTVANSSQTVTGTLNLDAFGVQAGSTGSSTDPYMYAATSGYRNDGDVGLSLVGARYYDSAVGRFITRDTDLTQKPYCYCNGDPVNKLDPSGHGPEWALPVLLVVGTIVLIFGVIEVLRHTNPIKGGYRGDPIDPRDPVQPYGPFPTNPGWSPGDGNGPPTTTSAPKEDPIEQMEGSGDDA